MRLHLVALPHTRVHADFNGCAYTAKNLKFAKMMGDRHDVIVYAPEGSDAPGAAEVVPVLSDAERIAMFGPDERNRLPAWPSDGSDGTPDQVGLFNERTAEAILERAQPQDLVLLTAGRTHWAIDAKLKDPGRRPGAPPKARARKPPKVMCIEPGVGYEGVFTQRCAFESHAWRHFVAGKGGHVNNAHWYDTVIPNYFDPADFLPPRAGGDYLLFLGRVNPDKGPHLAGQIAERLGMPLVIAGAGVGEVAPGRVVGNGVTITGDVDYYGPVSIAERAQLLAGAACLLAPTLYVEPFGGVAVEAMMAGVPAVTTNIGAFTETVAPGVSGYRFDTFCEGVQAVQDALELDPAGIRDYAMANYSLDAVGPMFDRWLARQLTSWHPDGWYAPLPDCPACDHPTP